jgi:peptidyl-prolyl cis-trans isomerase A (cyclophilin A)
MPFVIKQIALVLLSGLVLSACYHQVKPTESSFPDLNDDLSLVNNQEISLTMNDQATAEGIIKLEPNQKLIAKMITNQGEIEIELFADHAPDTVANFVGLAQGVRDWIDPETGDKVKQKFYDGLIFHRVIPGFMIQGGDPLGNGTGGPGYRFGDEFDSSLTFSQPYMLAMANAGPNTNGSQFFITVAPTPHLNGKHTIFGKVITGQEVVEAIANVPTGPNDKPLEDVVINQVVIEAK